MDFPRMGITQEGYRSYQKSSSFVARGNQEKALTLHVAIEMCSFFEWMQNFLISRGRYLFRQDQSSTAKGITRQWAAPVLLSLETRNTRSLGQHKMWKNFLKNRKDCFLKVIPLSSEILTCQKGEVLVVNLQLQDLNSYDVTISKQLGILLKRPLGTQGVQPPCHISFLSEESNKVGFFLSCNDLFAISLLDFRSDLFRWLEGVKVVPLSEGGIYMYIPLLVRFSSTNMNFCDYFGKVHLSVLLHYLDITDLWSMSYPYLNQFFLSVKEPFPPPPETRF